MAIRAAIKAATSRRRVLAGLGGAGLALLAPRPGRAAGDSLEALFVSCAGDPEGGYLVAGLDRTGQQRFALPLPARGHALAFRTNHPDCVVFARRPGDFALVLDGQTGAVTAQIGHAPDRRFQGHGVFSADGHRLFATENDYEAGRGVLGVYDAAAGYRRLGELPSHGVGPHELRRLPDGHRGQRLVVANGGIHTHPDQGRAKLNIETMAPNLVLLDAADGQLLDQIRLPQALHKLSIRHLDVTRDGRVAIAMQYEGDRRDEVPLIGLYDGGETIAPLQAPPEIARRMRHYTGSIAFDRSGRFLAVSSPRGHLVTLWDAARRRFLHAIEARDASGLAASGTEGEFLVSGGDGALRLVDAQSGESRPLADAPLHWDNHLAAS